MVNPSTCRSMDSTISIMLGEEGRGVYALIIMPGGSRMTVEPRIP